MDKTQPQSRGAIPVPVDVPAARASTPALSEANFEWQVAGADQEIVIGIDIAM
jgi:hypothetical protein